MDAEEPSYKWLDESNRDYGHDECRGGPEGAGGGVGGGPVGGGGLGGWNLMGETMLGMRYASGGWGGGKWRCPSAALLRIQVCGYVSGAALFTC